MKISLFCFWLCWFLAERAFFLVTATGSNSQIMAHRLTAGASLVTGHGLQVARASVAASSPRELRSCGSWALERRLDSRVAQAQLFLSPWDLSRSGIEPMSPALAGGFFTTESPGKPQNNLLISICTCLL